MLDGKKPDDTQVQQQILTTLQAILQRLSTDGK